jgi:HEAT repeats
MPRPLRFRPLPEKPSLEQLKRQAKELLEGLHQGDPRAHRLFGRCFRVTPEDRTTFKLTQAQLVLAREHGFRSWPQLAAWVADRTLPTDPARLVQILGSRTRRVRAAVELRLESLGKPGVDAAIAGLSDPDPRVRCGAADFMDHHADEDCVEKLRDMALNDPVPYVRDMALHALGCQRCKPAPLAVDTLDIIILRAKTEASWKKRRGAVWSLSQRNMDPGVKEALEFLANHDPDPRVADAARGGLKRKRPGPAHERENRLRRLAFERAAQRPPQPAPTPA